MILAVIIFLGLSSAMVTPTNCRDLEKMTQAEKAALSKELGLVFDIFDEKLYAPHDYGKSYISHDKEAWKQYVIRYNVSNKIIAQQFRLHYNVVFNHHEKLLRPDEAYCLVSATLCYMVYKYVNAAFKEYPNNVYEDVKDLNYSFINLIEFFRKFEQHNVIFTTNQLLSLIITPDGQLKILPLDLSIAYPRDEEGYVDRVGFSELRHPAEINERFIIAVDKRQFRIKTTNKKMQRISFIDFLVYFLISKFRSKYFNNDEKLVTQLIQKLYKLVKMIFRSETEIYQWPDMDEFIKSWGTKGLLADFVDGKIDRISTKRRSSFSSSGSSDMEEAPGVASSTTSKKRTRRNSNSSSMKL